MNICFSVIAAFFFLTIPLAGYGSQPEKTEKSASSGYELRIQKLIENGSRAQQLRNNLQAADSLYSQAVLLAQTSFDQKLILQALNAYFEGMDGSPFNEKRLSLIPEAKRIVNTLNNNELASETYINIAGIYRSAYKFEKALEYSYKAFNAAELSGNSRLKAESYLSIGKSMEGKNQLLEAFRNYLQAMNIGENKEDHVVLDHACKAISRFYNLNKDFDNAIKFKLKQLELLNKSQPLDSLAYMWLQFELEEISYNARKTVNEYNLERLLAFAKKHQNPKLNEFI